MNWCPGLGTVLANEEVTADGRSERGNFPVFRRSLKQWMMRITAYADRLVADLDRLDWPDSVKAMQRNWIGRSEGARVRFDVVGAPAGIEVFTTRPDTLFGATYMVLAPEHPLVEQIVPGAWPLDTDPRWTAAAVTDPATTRPPRTPCAAAARAVSDARRGRRRLPRGRGAQVRAGPPGEQGQDRRLHRRPGGQPGQRPGDPGVRRRLRADGLRHRRDHGRSRAGPARLGLRGGVRAADHPDGRACGRAGRAQAYTGDGPGDQLVQRRDQPGRAGRRRGQAGDHGLAGRQGDRRGRRPVQAARLAVLPAALLG